MRFSRNGGFTLIEILIVVAIIGVLAGIAIPQFASYRDKSYCATIRADLANLAIAQEAYFIENDVYLVTTHNADGSSNVPNFRWSRDVTLLSSSADNSSPSSASWITTAGHPNCSYNYKYDSSGAGLTQV